MKPRFHGTQHFRAEVTKRTTRSFLVLRWVYLVTVSDGFYLQDEDGVQWRPCILGGLQTSYHSDGSTVPHPIDWLCGAFDPLKYRWASMGIHDPACATGHLECRTPLTAWQVASVSRSKADDLIRQGVDAEGGWLATSKFYWFGVRAGAALGVGVRK